MEVNFKVVKWDEESVNENPLSFPVNIAHVEYEIDGELKGKAYVEYLLCYLNSDSSDAHKATAKISGYLYFEGTYKNHKGTFTAAEHGIFDKGNLDSPGTIIEAKGALENLKGSYNYIFIGKESKMVLDFDWQ